jgi:urease accessory protein
MKSQLEVSRVRDCNTATKLISQSPLKLIPTASIKDELRIMTSSYGGGILQGDQIEFEIHCKPHSSLLLQSQGNQHLYKSNRDDGQACQKINGFLEQGAKALIIPEPSVLHEYADFYQVQEWDCHPESNLLLLDYIHIGRSENGEEYIYKKFQSDICLKVLNKKIYLDRYLSIPSKDDQDLKTKFGPYKLMLNIVSYGKEAIALHKSIAEEFDSSEVARFGELGYQTQSEPPHYYMASCCDSESQTMTSRALFKQRKQSTQLTEKLLSGSFFS